MSPRTDPPRSLHAGVDHAASDMSSTGAVGRIPIGGGTPTGLATERLGVLVAVAVASECLPHQEASAVSSTSLDVWVGGEGTIAQGVVTSVPTGGSVAVLASGLSNPSAVVVDDSGVHFNNVAGRGLIEKIATWPSTRSRAACASVASRRLPAVDAS